MASVTTEYIPTVNINLAQRSFVLSLLERGLNSAQDTLAQWVPIQSFAKAKIIELLGKITYGQLRVKSLGKVYDFGSPYTLEFDGFSSQLRAEVTVLDESFWTRLCLHADFGFADAYMLQHIEVDNLNSVFRIFVLNRQKIGELSTLLTPIFRGISYVSNTRFANQLTGSKSNISAHYDLSNEAFAAFLSWDMTFVDSSCSQFHTRHTFYRYSCAIFDDEAKGCVGDLLEKRPIAPPRKHQKEERESPDDLERGQLAKLHMIAERARIKKGSRVLEIGCGWGSFSILAARHYGATVEAITISDVQKVAIDANIRAEGLEDMITVHVLDYRSLPESFHHAFDSVVSIGVMEHVGIEFMQGWFEQMSWAMKPKNSFKVFTMSTVPDTRWHMYSSEVDFVRKYIYPGGQLSSVRTLVDCCTKAGLNVESIENIGPHYARTLREWSYRFERNFESHIVPALLEQYPKLTSQDIEIFRRKWIYYFAYSEAGFALRSVSDHVFVLTREANLRV